MEEDKGKGDRRECSHWSYSMLPKG